MQLDLSEKVDRPGLYITPGGRIWRSKRRIRVPRRGLREWVIFGNRVLPVFGSCDRVLGSTPSLSHGWMKNNTKNHARLFGLSMHRRTWRGGWQGREGKECGLDGWLFGSVMVYIWLFMVIHTIISCMQLGTDANVDDCGVWSPLLSLRDQRRFDSSRYLVGEVVVYLGRISGIPITPFVI